MCWYSYFTFSKRQTDKYKDWSELHLSNINPLNNSRLWVRIKSQSQKPKNIFFFLIIQMKGSCAFCFIMKDLYLWVHDYSQDCQSHRFYAIWASFGTKLLEENAHLWVALFGGGGLVYK